MATPNDKLPRLTSGPSASCRRDGHGHRAAGEPAGIGRWHLQARGRSPGPAPGSAPDAAARHTEPCTLQRQRPATPVGQAEADQNGIGSEFNGGSSDLGNANRLTLPASRVAGGTRTAHCTDIEAVLPTISIRRCRRYGQSRPSRAARAAKSRDLLSKKP